MRGLFCTYEKTAVAAEYFEIVGLEEVEVFLPLTRLPISEYTVQHINVDVCCRVAGPTVLPILYGILYGVIITECFSCRTFKDR